VLQLNGGRERVGDSCLNRKKGRKKETKKRDAEERREKSYM